MLMYWGGHTDTGIKKKKNMQLLYFRLNNQLKLLKGLFNNIMIKDIQLNV